MLRVLRDFPENFLNIFSDTLRARVRVTCVILSFFLSLFIITVHLRFSCDSLAVQLRFTCGAVGVHLRCRLRFSLSEHAVQSRSLIGTTGVHLFADRSRSARSGRPPADWRGWVTCAWPPDRAPVKSSPHGLRVPGGDLCAAKAPIPAGRVGADRCVRPPTSIIPDVLFCGGALSLFANP